MKDVFVVGFNKDFVRSMCCGEAILKILKPEFQDRNLYGFNSLFGWNDRYRNKWLKKIQFNTVAALHT